MKNKSDIIFNNDIKIFSSNAIFLFYIVISIISIFICLIIDGDTNKSSIVWLPICFTIFVFLFCLIKKRNFDNNLSIILINSLFFVRLSILPILYSFNIDSQIFFSKYNIGSHFDKACLLMVYEFIAVQITMLLHLLIKKRKKMTVSSKKQFSSKTSDYLVLFLTLFIAFCFIFFKSYLPTFKSIFSLGKYEFTTITSNSLYNMGSFERIISTLFVLSFHLFRIMFPAYLINKCYRKNSKYTWFVLVMSCFLQFMFITSTFAEAIISCLCLILYYIKLYPENRKKAYMFLLLSVVGIFMLFFVVRFFVKVDRNYYRRDNPLFYYAQMTNSYFTGIDNVSAIFNVSSSHKLEAFKSDIIGSIPFNSTIFNHNGNKLQYYYNYYNKTYGQIQPTIGAGYYYFGYLLAPLFSIIFTKLSLIYYDKSKKIKESFKYVATIFCCILFALGIVMYNPEITLSWYLGWGLLMIIISKYSEIV